LSSLSTLKEPFKSYFLTMTLRSPQRMLLTPTFEGTAQRVAGYGPNEAVAGLVVDADDDGKERESEHRLVPEMEVSPGPSALPQTDAPSADEVAATLDATASPPTLNDDVDGDDAGDHEEFQQKVMKEAFARFQRRKESESRSHPDVEPEEQPFSAPPAAVDSLAVFEEEEEEEVAFKADADAVDRDIVWSPPDDGGSVTPPMFDEEVLTQVPSPRSLGLAVPALDDGNSRSSGYHRYQPSWVDADRVAVPYHRNTANIYFPGGDALADGYGAVPSMGDPSSYSIGRDSDDDIDDDLDYRRRGVEQQQPPSAQFSRRYIDLNRNQSIMRLQDIVDGAKSAEQDLVGANQESINQFAEFVPKLLEPDSPIFERPRSSKYSMSSSNRKMSDRSDYSVSNRMERSSVSSHHSFAYKKEFGSFRKHQRHQSHGHKQQSVLQRFKAWTK